jgi:hypothetical protein
MAGPIFLTSASDSISLFSSGAFFITLINKEQFCPLALFPGRILFASSCDLITYLMGFTLLVTPVVKEFLIVFAGASGWNARSISVAIGSSWASLSLL